MMLLNGATPVPGPMHITGFCKSILNEPFFIHIGIFIFESGSSVLSQYEHVPLRVSYSLVLYSTT